LAGGFSSQDELNDHELAGSALWGSNDSNSRASRVVIDDAVVQGEYTLELRQSTSIEREHGVVAAGHLFSREVISAEAVFSFSITVEADDTTEDQAIGLLDTLQELLTNSELFIGAGSSAGLGSVGLIESLREQVDLRDWAGIRGALAEPATDPLSITQSEVRSTAREPRTGLLRVTGPWAPDGALLSKVASVGGPIDAFPLTAQTADGVRLLYPGTSVKGVFRSHAERIVRTVSGVPLPKGGILEQLKATNLTPIADLFGTAGDTDGSGARGAVSFHDVLSRHPLDRALWNEVRFAEGAATARADDKRSALAHAAAAVDELNAWGSATHGDEALWFDVATRIAIDRWTGAPAQGESGGMLFTSLEPWGAGPGSWGELVIDLDWALLVRRNTETGSRVPFAALALLMLVLRDFAEGWIGFGSGTTRGLGSISVLAEQLVLGVGRGDFAGRELIAALEGKSLADAVGIDPDLAELAEQLDHEWAAVVKHNADSAREAKAGGEDSHDE